MISHGSQSTRESQDQTVRLPNGTYCSPKRTTHKIVDEYARTNSPSGKPGHCLDELCNCTKHACKPAWKPNPAHLDGMTIYKQDFGPKELQREHAAPRQHVYKPTKFEGESTNHADFRTWDAQKSPSCKPQDRYKQGLPFEGTSMYRQDFDKKPIEQHSPRQRMGYKPNPAHFDDMTSNKAAFVAHPVQERKSFSPSRAVGKAVPFEGSSNYRDEFKPWELEKRSPRHANQYKSLPDDRNFQTETSREYNEKQIQREKPVQRNEWKPNPAKFDGTTTYSHDHTPMPIETRHYERPVNTYKPTKFEGESTNHADFRTWDAQKSPSCKPQDRYKQGLPFEGTSMYRQDFDKKPIEQHSPRQRMGYKPNPAHFDGMTSNKAAFVAHPVQERKSFSPSRAVGKAVPFEGSSNYRDEFKPWELEKKNPRQSQQYKSTPDDRHFDSTYGSSYVKYERTPCPVHALPTAPAIPQGREHVYWDQEAGKWY